MELIMQSDHRYAYNALIRGPTGIRYVYLWCTPILMHTFSYGHAALGITVELCLSLILAPLACKIELVPCLLSQPRLPNLFFYFVMHWYAGIHGKHLDSRTSVDHGMSQVSRMVFCALQSHSPA